MSLANKIRQGLSNKSALAALCVSPLFTLSPQVNSADGISFNGNSKNPLYGSFDIGLTYERPLVSQVRNIPLSVRNIPPHPEDSYAFDGRGPISQDYLDLSGRINWATLKGGVQGNLFKNKLALRTGIGLDALSSANWTDSREDRKDIARRDYALFPGSDQRGTGTALTYIWAKEKSMLNWLRPYAFGEAAIKLGENGDLVFGTKFYRTILEIETGYDRWNALKELETYKVGDFSVIAPYVGLDFKFKHKDERPRVEPFFSIQGGLQKAVGANLKDFGGHHVDVDYSKPSYFIGAKIGARF